MNNKEKILQATIQAFNQKGLKFTMDDIASILAMSKKTIYTIFKDKNTLFMEMVDYLFDTIKESESEIIEDNTLSTIEKIRRILGVMPESYKDIDLRTNSRRYTDTLKNVWRMDGRQRLSFWNRGLRKK